MSRGPLDHGLKAHFDDVLAQRVAEFAPHDEPAPQDDPELAVARAHARACPACAALVESYAALAEALAGLPAAAPPPDFTPVVLARIDARERESLYARQLAAGIALASCALAALLLALAGGAAWAPALARTGALASELLRAVDLAGTALGPVVRAFRPQLLAWGALAAILLLLGLRRLTPSAGEGAGRSLA